MQIIGVTIAIIGLIIAFVMVGSAQFQTLFHAQLGTQPLLH